MRSSAWGLTAAVVLVAGGVAGCSDDEDPAAPTTTEESSTTTTSSTTTAPERPASTTTTALDPATVEGQVEAAYLRSWDVYADAVYNLELDEEALAEVFTGDQLETKRQEITSRIADGRAAHVRLEHQYEIVIVDDTTSVVTDRFINHQVLIDPKTKQAVEPDPNAVLTDVVTLRLEGGTWKVSFKDRFR